jgi:hypothetical protein
MGSCPSKCRGDCGRVVNLRNLGVPLRYSLRTFAVLSALCGYSFRVFITAKFAKNRRVPQRVSWSTTMLHRCSAG